MYSRRVAGLFALLCLAAAPSDTLPNTEVPLFVRSGHCTFVLPTNHRSDKYLLVVGSLSRGSLTHRVTVHTATTSDPVFLPQVNDDPGPAWRRRVDDVANHLEQARKNRQPADDYPPASDPPRRRVFHFFTGEHDFNSSRAYAAVSANLRGLGRHCLVYVDADYSDPNGLQPAVDEVVNTFDNMVYPAARREQGRCLDVDRDGRFTMLFSGRLARMSNGKVSLGGFVLGSDFYRDEQITYSNHCDMLYLNTDLRPGPYLRTLVAHEYTHAVVYSEHVFGNYLPGARRTDEESWLNEGLAHLAEERHGFSWGNLDYRVCAFLNAPQRYPLVVPDYYDAGLWRNPGCRGATYLFMHTCARQYPDLSAKLVQSNLAGVTNLEAATHKPFASLFRRWTVAVAHGVIPGGHDLHRPLGSHLLCGPRQEEITLSGSRWETDLAGTAAAYLLLHSATDQRTRVTIETDADADLQVTLLPLPSEMARLSLKVESVRPGACRLIVTAHDADVTLEEIAREKAAATDRILDTTYRTDAVPGASVRAWFGEPKLTVGVARTSNVIELPAEGKGTWLFKVSGSDTGGRKIAARAEVLW